MTTFSQQIAVVTGAGSGIGKAVALALGTLGARLALVGRRPTALETIVSLARSNGVIARAYPCDLARGDEVSELASTLGQDFGRVDVLVHSAGVIHLGPVAEAGAAHFDGQYRTNVLGPFLLTQRLLPLIRSRQGQIVFINSSVGLTARANVGQYAATKHALKALADSLRDEVNRDGIRVLSVFAGRTATPMQERVHDFEQRPYRPDRLLQPEDVGSIVVNALCLPRTAEVTEIKIRPLAKLD
jgi:NAD(P)-dependent dehydrogenase (short-subunit alcohol dehydrogenase family)